MGSSKLKLAMVGGGGGAFIGAVHRQAIRQSDRFELVAGCFSRSPDNNTQSAAELGIAPARCYPDYASLIEAEAGKIDAIVIATPNNSHFPITQAALAAGIHVFCEKPAAMSLAEVVSIRDTLQAGHAHYMLAHTYLGYPLVGEMRRRILAGQIGRVRRIDVAYRQGWLSEPVERSGNRQAQWRTDPAQAGLGGALGDIGTHAFVLAEYATGERIDEVCAQVNTVVAQRMIDDDVAALFTSESGCVGTLVASQICIGEENDLSIAIYGETGALKWRQENPQQLEHRMADGDIALIKGGSNGPRTDETTRAAYALPMGHPEGYLEAFRNLYTVFADRIEGRAEEGPGIEEAVRGMAFIETMILSAHKRERVRMTDTLERNGA